MLGAKFLIFLGCAIAVCVTLPADESFPAFGGVQPLTGERLQAAEETLQTSLDKIAAGDGPSYKIGKIISATSQVIAGSLDKYEVELITSDNVTKVCNVQIISQPWLPNGIEVTIDCPGEAQVVRKHSA